MSHASDSAPLSDADLEAIEARATTNRALGARTPTGSSSEAMASVVRDIAFIATSRKDIPVLCAEVRRLRSETADAGRSPTPTRPPEMTAEKLRTLASWLDTYDRMAAVFWDLCEKLEVRPPEELQKAREVSAGKEVQVDLRAWADAIDPGGA